MNLDKLNFQPKTEEKKPSDYNTNELILLALGKLDKPEYKVELVSREDCPENILTNWARNSENINIVIQIYFHHKASEELKNIVLENLIKLLNKNIKLTNKASHFLNYILLEKDDDTAFLNKVIKADNEEACNRIAYTSRNQEILVKLSKNFRQNVKVNISRNMCTPIEAIIELYYDKDAFVSSHAAETLKNKTLDLIRDNSNKYDFVIEIYNRGLLPQLLALSESEYTPIPVVEKLATHPDKQIRANIAKNNITPREILLTLKDDRVSNVKGHARLKLQDRFKE